MSGVPGRCHSPEMISFPKRVHAFLDMPGVPRRCHFAAMYSFPKRFQGFLDVRSPREVTISSNDKSS